MSIVWTQSFHCLFLSIMIGIAWKYRERLGHPRSWAFISAALILEIIRSVGEGFNVHLWQSRNITMILHTLDPVWSFLLATGIAIHLHGRGVWSFKDVG